VTLADFLTFQLIALSRAKVEKFRQWAKAACERPAAIQPARIVEDLLEFRGGFQRPDA
jgi:hypothetical protein